MPSGMSAEAIGERIASVRLQVGRELCAERWMLLVLGGEWDGRIIPLVQPKTELGRGSESGITREGNTTRVAFPQSYRSVTRLEKPHAVVRIHGDKCAIEDAGSRGVHSSTVKDHSPGANQVEGWRQGHALAGRLFGHTCHSRRQCNWRHVPMSEGALPPGKDTSSFLHWCCWYLSLHAMHRRTKRQGSRLSSQTGHWMKISSNYSSRVQEAPGTSCGRHRPCHGSHHSRQ